MLPENVMGAVHATVDDGNAHKPTIAQADFYAAVHCLANPVHEGRVARKASHNASPMYTNN